jgi:hypothetical protein
MTKHCAHLRVGAATLAVLLLVSAAAHAGAESIEYWKCGPYNIRINRDTGDMWGGVSFDTTKGKEVRRDHYNFLRERAGTDDENESKFASWSGQPTASPCQGGPPF